MTLKKISYPAFILILFLSVSVFSTDTYTAVASYFAEYDKVLEEITVDAQSVTSLSGTEKMFKKKIEQMPAFEYLMRTNSKGKIISKVTEDGIQPRNFRFIGKQQWYEVIALTVKPYYGMMKSRKNYALFWNKPIPVKGSSGVRFGGSISAKINLKKAFKDISEKEMAEFTVKLGRKVLFSNLKDDGTRKVTKPLSINGLPVLTIIYSEYADGRKESAPASFSVAKDEKAAVKEEPKKETIELAKQSKKVNAKSGETKVAPKEAAEKSKEEASTKKITPTKEKHPKKKSAGGSIVILVVILLAALVGVIVAIVIIMQSAQKKRKALLEAIDKGEI